MRIEDLTINLRPRRGWEAVDLGLQMTRHWAAAIYLPWLILYLLLAGILVLLLPDSLGWVAFILWWLKPGYDRLILFVLSRAVFGQVPSAWETLTTSGTWLRTGLLTSLTLGRLNPARSFHLPVRQLEGLSAGAASRRRRTLNSQAHGHASGLTLVWVHLEMTVWVSLLALAFLLVPEELDVDWWGFWIEDEQGMATPLILMTQIIATGLLEPFYVGGGFALYLNRRSELEGWDLELAFRRLTNRVEGGRRPGGLAAGVLAAAIGLTALTLGTPPSAQADSVYRQKITEILASDEFEDHRTVTSWEEIDPDDKTGNDGLDFDWLDGIDGLEDVIRLLAESGRLLMWVGLGVLLFLLLRNRARIAALLGRLEPQRRSSTPPPTTVAGLDIRPESLPDDIAAAALRAWRSGDARASLSLLYRGSLSALVHRFELRLKASYTEGDILARLGEQPGPRLDYMQRLTLEWQGTAYAHRQPSDASITALCEAWRPLFRDPGEELQR